MHHAPTSPKYPIVGTFFHSRSKLVQMFQKMSLKSLVWGRSHLNWFNFVKMFKVLTFVFFVHIRQVSATLPMIIQKTEKQCKLSFKGIVLEWHILWRQYYSHFLSCSVDVFSTWLYIAWRIPEITVYCYVRLMSWISMLFLLLHHHHLQTMEEDRCRCSIHMEIITRFRARFLLSRGWNGSSIIARLIIEICLCKHKL